MDPDETLREMRAAIQDAHREAYTAYPVVNDLVKAFEELDLWIMHGGYLPKDWKEALQGREVL